MIERERLREYHRQNLPLHILEQDYIQALFLSELYSRTDNLVFKGGTYLKHAQGLDRYSEDLDFTENGEENTEKKLAETAEQLSYYNINAELKKISENTESLTAQLLYEGPLYDGSERSKGRIDIEISRREDLLHQPEWIRLFFDYPETGTFACLGMKLEEVMAEKLRALTQRNKARDLYDVWFLINKDVEIRKELFENKMKAVNAEPEATIKLTENEWKHDLEILLQNPPSFKETLQKVRQELERSQIKTRKTT